MVICRSHIGPATARQGPEDASAGDDLWQRRVRPCGQEIPETNKSKSRTGSDGNEYLKDGTLWVPVANGGRHRGEPFLGIAVILILHNLVVMKLRSNDQCAEKGKRRE